MAKIKGKVKAVSGPNMHEGVMQIGFILMEDPEKWHNISGEESYLKDVLDTKVKKGAEIEFDEDEYKNITNMKLIKEASESKSKNVVNIKGKDFMTYEGLLKKAHEKGGFSMEITDSWVSEDMKMAWCKVRLTAGKQTFDGFGSSTPDNTGDMTQTHPVEMSHTRAKGRALRDFLNIGQVMAEELKQEK